MTFDNVTMDDWTNFNPDTKGDYFKRYYFEKNGFVCWPVRGRFHSDAIMELQKEIDEWIEIDDPYHEYIPCFSGDLKLYFIQEGHNGNIKIGSSIDPTERIKALQIGNSNILRLLWFVSIEDPCIESVVHKYLSHWSVNGEWFKPSVAVLTLINETMRHSFDGSVYGTNYLIWKNL